MNTVSLFSDNLVFLVIGIHIALIITIPIIIRDILKNGLNKDTLFILITSIILNFLMVIVWFLALF